MKIRILSLALSSVLLLAACGKDEKLILDVRSVINKSPEEVVSILGEPDTTYTEKIPGKEIFCQRYREHNIEIQYPESLSTDIVVYGPHNLAFTQSALEAFNIRYQEQHPSQYERDAVMRWYDFKEFAAISFYNVQKNPEGVITNYTIYFKAKEKE